MNADVIWGIGTPHWVSILSWDPNAKPKPVVASPAAQPSAVAAKPVAAKVAAVAPSASVAPVEPAKIEPVRVEAARLGLASPIATVPDPVDEPAEFQTAVTALIQPVRLFNEEVTKVSAPRADFEEVTKISARREDFEDVTVMRGPRPDEAWHLAFDGRSLGPFTRPGLIVELRRLESIDGASLWTKGMREWAPVVEFLDILNELGANQRLHTRAELEGQVTLTYDGLSRTASLNSISEGGVGVNLNSELVAGQIVEVEVKSKDLGAVKAAAEIRYCANGVVGLRFTAIDAEARASIARFVRQHSAGAQAA